MLQVKDSLKNRLEEFFSIKLTMAIDVIVNNGQNLIKKKDNILVYGLNDYLKRILSDASKVHKKAYSLIYIIDKHHNPNTNQDIEFLSSLGVSISMTYISSISGVIAKASKIFMLAKSMLSNGNMLGEVGSSLIANVAFNYKKPVIIFCESFKFWDKIQIDSFHTPNVRVSEVAGLDLNKITLNYDITPSSMINMVVCELGMIPSSSVKVVIREYVNEDEEI